VGGGWSSSRGGRRQQGSFYGDDEVGEVVIIKRGVVTSRVAFVATARLGGDGHHEGGASPRR